MKRFRYSNLGATLLLVLAATAGCPNGDGTLDVSGQIEGISADAGSKVGGRVARVAVEEGQRVRAGDVLVVLEASEAEARLAMAQAKLAQAEAQLEKARTGARAEEVRQAEAALAQAEEQYRMAVEGPRPQEVAAAEAQVAAAASGAEDARLDFERAERLRGDGGVISQRDYDKAKTALDAARARLRAAREQLDALTEGTRAEQVGMAKAGRDQAQAALDALRTGTRHEDLKTAEALRDEAAAAVRMAEVTLDEMTVRAPMDGVVESLDVQPGDLVQPGPIARVTNPDALELRVYVSAAALGFIHVGDTVPLTTDSHGDEPFEGRVTFIASEGEFTPRNLQTEEERIRQMFAVELALDSAGGKLRPGMTAVVHLPVGGDAA